MPIIYTTSKKADVEEVLRNLPAILAGTHPDPHGIAEGLRNRHAFAFFGLVSDACDEKGRGRTGSDGITWQPLSPAYLAYSRPLAGRKKPKAGKHAPGGNDGLLTESQLKQWRKIFAFTLGKLAGKYPLSEAKRRAAVCAWQDLKKMGAKTKIADPGFGGRVVGQDYQIHVISGTFRHTLQPGVLTKRQDGGADYFRDDDDQIQESYAGTMIVGSNFEHASRLHKLRPLWPEEPPPAWMDELDNATRSGIMMFVRLVELGKI
ncbi:MAG: hypothetical protein ACIALR_05475 [Blastopirellula sp. JB062]